MKIPLLFALACMSATACGEDIVFPPESGTVDVRERYGAKGDGVTDDSQALQRAFFENKGKGLILYFPNGRYLVSRTIFIGGDAPSEVPIASRPHSSDRFVHLQGQSQAGAIICLKDRSSGFADPANPKVMISLYDGPGTGDAMQSSVRNLTFEVGAGNPGAAALRFLSNNTGCIAEVTIRSRDPKRAGAIGLDLRQGQQGPELIRDVTIEGFDRGVQTGDTFSIVFERLTLRNQNEVGFFNPWGRVTIKDLVSSNRVPVVRSGKDGPLTIIGGSFTGGDPAAAALITEGRQVFLRDLKQTGYGAMVEDAGRKRIPGATLAEWCDGGEQGLFTEQRKSLRLVAKDPPRIPWERDFKKWIVLDDTAQDDTSSIQQQIDDGAKRGVTTLCFKPGEKKYLITAPVRIHGSIQRIVGMHSLIDVRDPSGVFKDGKTAVFAFDGMLGKAVIVERFFLLGGWDGPQTASMFANTDGIAVVLSSVCLQGAPKTVTKSGEWFFEDVSPGRSGTLRVGRGEKVWARQYNPESAHNDMIEVSGGQLWILNLKTEGRATHLVARDGASVEILGGVSYQSWGNQEFDPPMFRIIDSRVAISMNIWSTQCPFSKIVEETLAGKIRTLLPNDLKHGQLGLYRAGVDR